MSTDAQDFDLYPTTAAAGEYRALALLPRRFPAGVCAPLWGGTADTPLIPREKWAEFSLRDYVCWQPLNQSTTNLCHSFAATQAHMLARAIAGLPFIELSAGSLAGWVTGNRNVGASLDDVLPVLQDHGQTPATEIGQLDYRARPSTKQQEIAAAFAVPEVWDLGHSSVFDGLASAIQTGNPCAFGMKWGNGGHALCALAVVRLKSQWGLQGIGSWGPTAHDGDGFWTFTESELVGLERYGAFAVRAVRRQNDLHPPILQTAV